MTTAMTRKGWNAPPSVTEEEARDITEQIRTGIEDVWRLLVRAHETKAWKALGYERWADYISSEFQRSRQWAYQLLDQGEVILAIEQASGVSTRVDISEREARDIKPLLPVVVENIKYQIERGEEPEVAVRTTIGAAREAAATPQGRVGTRVYKGRPADEVLTNVVTTLRAAVQTIRSLDSGTFGDEAPVDEWIREIDRTTKELRAFRAQLRERYGIQ